MFFDFNLFEKIAIYPIRRCRWFSDTRTLDPPLPHADCRRRKRASELLKLIRIGIRVGYPYQNTNTLCGEERILIERLSVSTRPQAIYGIPLR